MLIREYRVTDWEPLGCASIPRMGRGISSQHIPFEAEVIRKMSLDECWLADSKVVCCQCQSQLNLGITSGASAIVLQ